MHFDGKLNINKTDIIKKKRGLNNMGHVQKYIDSECIRLMSPYVPFVSGALEKTLTVGTKIGSGLIRQISPQSRYLYYGKLMVSSITGSSYARHGEKKVLTDKDLIYNKAGHQLAGPFWFKRMIADHKDDILEGAQKEANRGVK
jgi:hypothetical protein